MANQKFPHSGRYESLGGAMPRRPGEPDYVQSWRPAEYSSDLYNENPNKWDAFSKDEETYELLNLALERIMGAPPVGESVHYPIEKGEISNATGRQVVGLELEDNRTPAANMPWKSGQWPFGNESPRQSIDGDQGWANPPRGHLIFPWADPTITTKYGTVSIADEVKKNDLKQARDLAVQKIIGMLIPRRDSEAGLKAALEPIAGE